MGTERGRDHAVGETLPSRVQLQLLRERDGDIAAGKCEMGTKQSYRPASANYPIPNRGS